MVFTIISLGNSETSSKHFSRKLWSNGKHPVSSTISSSSNIYSNNNKFDNHSLIFWSRWQGQHFFFQHPTQDVIQWDRGTPAENVLSLISFAPVSIASLTVFMSCVCHCPYCPRLSSTVFLRAFVYCPFSKNDCRKIVFK